MGAAISVCTGCGEGCYDYTITGKRRECINCTLSALERERAARVAAEGECERLRKQMAKFRVALAPVMKLVRCALCEAPMPGFDDCPARFTDRAPCEYSDGFVALRAALDSPDAGAKGEVRCSRCHGDGYPECACKVDE